ncbi:hypothetical protein PCLA_04r0681 [Pseudomonas citronellolis]|nr:hypothetical protein PCLA_04r0681 [Pseudomonas citronellolis]
MARRAELDRRRTRRTPGVKSHNARRNCGNQLRQGRGSTVGNLLISGKSPAREGDGRGLGGRSGFRHGMGGFAWRGAQVPR